MFVVSIANYGKIIFALLTKVITFFMQVFIVKTRVFSLKKPILKCKVCLAIFLALNKQF